MKKNPKVNSGGLITAILVTIVALLPLSGFSVNINVKAGKNEKKVEYTVPISDFKSVSASTAIKIVYVQGPFTGKAKVTTTQTGQKYLNVKVSHGTLKAYYDVPNNVRNVTINGSTIITVQSPNLEEVSLSSAAELEIAGSLNESSVTFSLSSAAKANVKSINCDKLRADLSSSANLSIENLNGNAEVEASSAAQASLGKVSSTRSSFDASSAASVSINRISGGDISTEASSGAMIDVSRIDCMQVSGNASSGGRINLSGKCAMVSKSSSSGGTVDTGALSENKKVSSSFSSSSSSSSSYSSSGSGKSTKSKKTKQKSKKSNQNSGNQVTNQSGNLRIP